MMLFRRLSVPQARVAINTLSQLLGRVAGALTMLVVTVVVANQFGAQHYGDFTKIITYVSLFYIFADFGINAIFIQHDERSFWPSLVTVRMIGAGALIILALGILALLPGTMTQGYTPTVRLGILLFVPTILFQALITTANGVFQKKLQYSRATIALVAGSAVTLLLLFVSMGMGIQNVLVVVGAVGAGTVVAALVSITFAHSLVGRIQFTVSADTVKRLVTPALPLGVTLLFNLVYFKADSIILTIFRPTVEVGVYGLAYKIFEVLLVFPTFFMNAVYPFMVEQKNIRRLVRTSTLVLMSLALCATAAVWFGAPLVTLIKSDFVHSIGALRILSLGLPLFFVSSVTMWSLVALRKQKLLMVIYGISMLVNVIGNVILIPIHGYVAAAWMTIVGEAVVLALSGAALTKHI